MKKLMFIFPLIITSCTADIVGFDGGSYKPNALLVHDQSNYWLWIAFIIVIVCMFMIIKLLRRQSKQMNEITYLIASEIKNKDVKEHNKKAEWLNNNPGKTVNDYYKQNK